VAWLFWLICKNDMFCRRQVLTASVPVAATNPSGMRAASVARTRAASG
jgi:hypothetical protein